MSDADICRLGPRAVLLCRARGWSTQWDARTAQLLCEVAELADAIRGKRGNPTQEAGDVLLVLASLLEAHGIPMESAIEEAHRKIDALMDAPRYRGEHFTENKKGPAATDPSNRPDGALQTR
ncbi:MAG: hypothetical protein H6981_04600 [Gammaproteobacteria bacterium]|nr:hypothetical protein [Gammaproteobacteria bacterium]